MFVKICTYSFRVVVFFLIFESAAQVVACFGPKFAPGNTVRNVFVLKSSRLPTPTAAPPPPTRSLSRSLSASESAQFSLLDCFCLFFLRASVFSFLFFFVSASRCNLPTALQHTHTQANTFSIYIYVPAYEKYQAGRFEFGRFQVHIHRWYIYGVAVCVGST